MKMIPNFTEVMGIHHLLRGEMLLRGGMLFTLCVYHLAQLNNLDDSTVEQTMAQFNHLDRPTMEQTMIPFLSNGWHDARGHCLLCVDISASPT